MEQSKISVANSLRRITYLLTSTAITFLAYNKTTTTIQVANMFKGKWSNIDHLRKKSDYLSGFYSKLFSNIYLNNRFCLFYQKILKYAEAVVMCEAEL